MDKFERRRLRLIEVRDVLCGRSNATLADKLGRSPSYISRMLSTPDKKGHKNIGDDLIDVIDEVFWGERGGFESDYPVGAPEDLLPEVEYMFEGLPGREVVEIEKFEARASMGHGYSQPDADSVVEVLRVSGDWIRRALPQISAPNNLAVLPAYGDSMEPTFSDSDLLWVDRGVTEVKIDAIYVLALRDELYVKRLQRRPDGAILMISDNKNYDPYVIQNGERERFQVLGRVVFAWRGKRL